jgi:hypothetical protein
MPCCRPASGFSHVGAETALDWLDRIRDSQVEPGAAIMSCANHVRRATRHHRLKIWVLIMAGVFHFVSVSGSSALVEEPTNGGRYNDRVAIRVADWNAIGHNVFLNGQMLFEDTIIEEEGNYELEIESRFDASIQYSAFQIDRTPPRIVIDTENQSRGLASAIRIEDDAGLTKNVEILIDGAPYDRSEPLDPGAYLLEVSVQDEAGNYSSTSESIEVSSCEVSVDYYYAPPAATLSGIHYFPWHQSSAECTSSTNSYWCKCIWAPKGNLRPARGFYGSNNQTVTNQQINQMINHGADVLSVEWNGQTFETNNYLNHVVPSVSTRNIQMVLLYDASIRLGNPAGSANIDLTNSITYNKFVNDFTGFASSTNYFKNAKYLKFGGKPVVYIYITRAFKADTTAQLNAIQAAFDAIKQAAVNQGFSGGLHIVADHLFWKQSNSNLPNTQDYAKLKRMTGVSAVTAFAPVSTDQSVPQNTTSLVRPVKTWANKMAALYQSGANDMLGLMTYQGYPLINLDPGVFVQYNDFGLETTFCGSRPVVQKYNLYDGTDWTYMLQVAALNRRFIAERVTTLLNCSEIVATNSSNYTSIVWSYSYNEWAEGSGMEELSSNTTTWPYGFGMQVLQRLQAQIP